MRMLIPSVLVAVTASVSACATARTVFDGMHRGSSGGWLGATLDRSIPNAPPTSPNAPMGSSPRGAASTGAGSTGAGGSLLGPGPANASFATALELAPITGRAPDFDPRGHELNRFRQPPPAPKEPPSATSMIVSGIVLVGVGIAYWSGAIKRGPQGGFVIGKGRLSSGRALLRVSPTQAGLQVKF